MAWKPWYQRVAEFDSAEERTEFLKGVFGPGKTTSGPGIAAVTITSFLAGWGVGSVIRDAAAKKDKK
jgi:hypothetical protein